jgi:hypothetical protein
LPVLAGLIVKPYSNAELFNLNAVDFHEKIKLKQMPSVFAVGASLMQ